MKLKHVYVRETRQTAIRDRSRDAAACVCCGTIYRSRHRQLHAVQPTPLVASCVDRLRQLLHVRDTRFTSCQTTRPSTSSVFISPMFVPFLCKSNPTMTSLGCRLAQETYEESLHRVTRNAVIGSRSDICQLLLLACLRPGCLAKLLGRIVDWE